MVAFCKASISHLLLPLPSSTKIPAPLTTRRLLLFSLSLPTLLLHESTDFSKSHDALAKGYDPVSPAEKDASVAINKRIADGLALLDKGRDAQANGDFKNALYYYSQVVDNYKDFAFSEYARVGRALSLYEVGDREEAIVEMEDVSISLKGYPEVHAALAAALYEDKHAPLLAENQFSIATLLDPHYTDISYVKDMKHWPPSLVTSLEHFITLS